MFGTNSPFGATSSSPFAPNNVSPNPFATSSSPFGSSPPANPFASPTMSSPFGQQTPPPSSSPSPFGSSTGVFGAPQAPSAFGSAAPLFGAQASTPTFGASPSPFGGTSVFGQSKPDGGGFGTFGSSQPNPFSTSAFGQASQPAFGQTSQPAFGSQFGASTPTFGAPSTTTFGAPSTPTFGAPSAPAFGATSTSAFGSSPPIFGASSTPAFGATSVPAFGASSTPAFGSTNAFGSTTPAFGASSTPAFGSTSVFGGASAPGFGTAAFGGASQKGGTRVQPFTPTPDTESGGVGPAGKFMTITAMQAYKNKSVEELRWEDYQANDKGGPNASGQAGSLFGQPQQSPFGASTPAFGSTANTTAFGASQTPAFGSSGTAFGASTPAFGTSSTPAFGASPSPFGGTSSAFGQASTPAFGQTTTPAFGQSPTPFGQSSTPFGQSSTPAFGQTPTSAFGQTPTSAFGQTPTSAFGQTPTSAFGQTPTSAFGQSPAPAFGQSSTPSFGQTSAPVFGQSSTPAFGASTSTSFGAASTPAFGSTSLFGSSTPAFGASSTPAFGFASTGSAFGASSSAFGGSSLFGSSQSAAPSFSFASSGPAFGSTQNSFGASSSASFGAPSLFGAGGASPGFGFGGTKPAGLAQSTSTSTFGGFGASSGGGQSSYNFGFSGSQPSQSSGPYGGPSLFGSTFGQQPQAQPVQMTQQMPTQSPFGNLPTIPDIQLGRSNGTQMPTMQYGISSLPVMDRPTQVRASSLLTPRLTPRSKVRMHARRYHPKKDSPRVSFFSDVEETTSSSKGDVMFVQRENPRALFIRQPEKMLSSPLSQSAPDTQEKDTAVQNGVERPEVPKNVSNGQPSSDTPAPESSRWAQQEGIVEDVIEDSPVGLPSSADRVVRASPVKQNGTHTSEHGQRGNGYASMTGHRAGEAAIAYEHGAEVEALMPKLRSNDYYTEPRIKDLAAKERVEPGYCKRVRDFTVGRKNYGYVRWLGETDVRGLDLEGIIEFKTREVLCYMTDESKKPEVGQGLNKRAEVTLLQVKCTDKRTQQAVREGPVLDAFVRRLRSKLEEQRAKFISYDPFKEEWKFNVEHFSKYGLGDESDGNEEVLADSMEGIEGGVGSLDDGMGLVPLGIEQKGREGMGLLISHEEMQEEMQRGSEQTGLRSYTPQDPLVYSLPAQLGLDPVAMQQMRSVLFPFEEDDSVLESKSSSRLGFAERRKIAGLSGKSQTESPEKLASVGRVMNRMSPGVSKFLSLTSVVSPNMQMVISPSLNRRGLSPFSRMEGISSPGLTGGSLLTPPYVPKFPLSGFSDPSLSLVKGKAGHGSDIGLFLGRSFRVGWGPNGVFVHAGMVVGSKNTASTGLSSRIVVQKVALDQAVRDETGKVRKELIQTHLVEPLELHRRLISTGGEVVQNYLMPGLKQESLQLRKVKCSKHKLLEVCDKYIFFGNQQAKTSGIPPGGALLLQHQEMVWGLTKVLFADWESGRPLVGLPKRGEQDYEVLHSSELVLSPDTEFSEDREGQDMEEINPDDEEEMVGTQEAREDHSEEMIDVEGDMKNQMELGFDRVRVEEVDAFTSPVSKMVYGNPTITNEAALRIHKARVSHWVQENVEHLVEKELSLSDELGLLTIFSHLTGHQLEEAVLKSIICGDVRLGLLLGEASMFMVTQADVISQLEEWEEQAVEGGIENDRKNIYHLLGGQLDLALEGRSIDWKRYLGILMWYQMSPDSDLRSIIRTFEKLVNAGEAPQPIPMYVEEGLAVGAPPPLSQAVFDTCYHLMLLHANAMEGVKLGGENLSNMFRTAASTYDWLDAQLGWHLYSVLQAVGAIESGGLHPLHMDFASQLLAVGQIHLALYVILHMPSAEGWEGLHEKTVREVLNLYCPIWRQSMEQCDFMRTTLQLPSKWIHGAQALYCRYRGDKEEELDHLLSSGQWLEAHTVYVQEIVANLFSQGLQEEAKRQVELLEAHKEEINGWETGGSLVYDYFQVTDAFSDVDFAVEELNSREKRTKFCEGIFARAQLLLESDTKPISLELRVCLSTLLDEISSLLIKDKDTEKIEESLLSHFLTDSAPLPEDLLFCRLQDSATAFTEWLVETTAV